METCSKKNGRFVKRHIPANKGKKWDEIMSIEVQEKCRKGWYQKGHNPHNSVPIGTEVLMNKDGYIKVKIAEPNKWAFKHRLIWEQSNGKIPRGYNVQFLNGNRTDCRIENLYLISRSDQINHNTIIRYPAELRQSIHKIAKMDKLINKIKHRS